MKQKLLCFNFIPHPSALIPICIRPAVCRSPVAVVA
jgi:hypothetical protein